jgi:hypothetical protein
MIRMRVPIDTGLTQEQRTAFAEYAKSDKKALAEIITEYVDPVYLTLDIAKNFMTTKEMKFGDILVKRFKGKYNVQQIVPGQITLGQQISIRDKALSYNLDIISAKAAYNTLELEHGGPQFTPETVKVDIQAALQEKLIMRLWNALANVWTTANASALTITGSGTSNWISGGAALTAASLDAAIDHVNYWSGSVKAIIGTETALAPLSEFGQYKLVGAVATDSGTPLSTNGQPFGNFKVTSPYGGGPYAVESYRGVSNIVRIPQVFDNTEYPPKPLLPDNYILVVGENIGEFITYGDPQVKEYIDNAPTPPNWNYEMWVQFGMMLTNARGLVKVELSTQTKP